MLGSLKAASAYGSQLQNLSGSFSPAQGAQTNSNPIASINNVNDDGNEFGGGFASLLSNQVSSTIAKTQAAESISIAAVQGNADLTAVVEAVNQAESSLRTIVKLRDRMTTAYQEILRMPI